MGCVRCDGPYNTNACPLKTETNAYMKNNPYSNTYNFGSRDHSNFSWGGQGQNNQGRQGDHGNYHSESPSYHQRNHHDRPHHSTP